MKKIKIYVIAKKQNDDLNYIKESLKFGSKIELINIFNKDIKEAQKQNCKLAQKSYSSALSKFIQVNSLNIALHPLGKSLDTFEFSKLLSSESEINFFIGGAFGFEEEFLKQTINISLSKLTLSHKIARIVLCEQIYRALCILNNHPYHKE